MRNRNYWMMAGVAGISATAALAQSSPQTGGESFTGVNNLIISEFTGRVDIDIAPGAVSASLTGGDISYPVIISQEGDTLSVTGPKRPKKFKLHKELNWHLYKNEAFARYVHQYPALTISVPEGTDLAFDDAIVIASVGDVNGYLKIDDGYVKAVIGDINDGNVKTHGGDIVIGSVSNHLRAMVGGSGDIRAENAGSAELLIGGSGDIELGDVTGDATLKVSGSGDIEIGDIGGVVSASISGSGDIETGKIDNACEMSVAGSGDIYSQSVNGPAMARIFGNGDIVIGGGRAEDLKVDISGSGDFEFDGVSTNLIASVQGSGSVAVAKNEGTLNTSGPGDFRIGGENLDNED